MPYRPLKNLSAGELKQLQLAEEDYLAFQAGTHLSLMDSSESSALTRFSGGTLVGTYEDTQFIDGTTAPAITSSAGVSATITSDVTQSTHTITASSGGIPTTLYVDDVIEIVVSGNATSTGNGFESITYSVSTSGSSTFTALTKDVSPTVTSGSTTSSTWQDFVDPTLSGTFETTFRFELEDEGSLNIVLNLSSVDNDNGTPTANESISFPTISVQLNRPPDTVITETDLYQNTPAQSPVETSGPRKKNPVYWNETNTGLKEMSDSELDVLCERFVSKIVNNEYPGVFRLGAAAPSSDWTVFLENI